MIKGMTPEQLPKRTITREGKNVIYTFDQVGELPKRKSKTPTVFAAKNLLTCHLFEYIKGFHVPTYFLEKESESSMKVKNTIELPFEIVIRNHAIGDFCKQYELEEGSSLATPIFDFHFTDPRFKETFINESYLCAFGFMEPEELKILLKQAGKINAVLKSFFDRRNLKLEELHLRFSRTPTTIVLSHEMSPDTMKISEKEKAKKGRFDLDENYTMAFYERVIGF